MTPARPQRAARAIDWTQVRDRLARARTAAEPAVRTPARTQAILAERARLLARRPSDTRMPDGTIDALTFALGPARYAIDTRDVREVTRLLDVTPVPGTPDFVAGVTSHRGQMLCLIELRSLLRSPVTPLADLSRMIVLGESAPEFAVLAEHADEILPLRPDEVLPGTGSTEYIRGVTAQGLVVLDGASLLRSPRLYVDQRDLE
jgi:purine-binding chemotaxis protein CheW